MVCQCLKVHRHTKAPLAHISFPKRRIAHVNVDLVGPLPPFFRFIYLLTMTDRKTRWLEAVPLSATTPAELVGDSGVHRPLVFGAHFDVSLASGPKLTSEVWNAIASGLGVKMHCNTAYHPQATGCANSSIAPLRLRASFKDEGWAPVGHVESQDRPPKRSFCPDPLSWLMGSSGGFRP